MELFMPIKSPVQEKLLKWIFKYLISLIQILDLVAAHL